MTASQLSENALWFYVQNVRNISKKHYGQI